MGDLIVLEPTIFPTTLAPPIDPPNLYTTLPGQTIDLHGSIALGFVYDPAHTVKGLDMADWYILDLTSGWSKDLTTFPGGALYAYYGSIVVLSSKSAGDGISVKFGTRLLDEFGGKLAALTATITIPAGVVPYNPTAPFRSWLSPYYLYCPSFTFTLDNGHPYPADCIFQPFTVAYPPDVPPADTPPPVYPASAQMVFDTNRRPEIIRVTEGGPKLPQALQLLTTPDAGLSYPPHAVPFVSTSGISNTYIQSPSLVVSRRSNLRCAYYSDTNFIYRVESRGSGEQADWGRPSPVQDTRGAALKGSHPYVVQDQNQGLDVLYMSYSGQNDHFSGCSVAESTDGGLSWTPLALVLAPYNSVYFGRPALVSVGNTLVMLYCSTGEGAYCTYSRDGGHTWQNGVGMVISSVGACNNCALAYHKGVLYAAARTHGMYSGGPIIGVLTATSTDMGVHWQPTGVLPDAAVSSDCCLGVEEYTGRLLYGTGFHSSDGGHTWSANS